MTNESTRATTVQQNYTAAEVSAAHQRGIEEGMRRVLGVEAERRAFEAFAREEHGDNVGIKMPSGHYKYFNVAREWDVWPAARQATAESAPRTFEQWWAEPTTTTAAPYTFMDEKSARAAWFAARSAAESAPASKPPP